MKRHSPIAVIATIALVWVAGGGPLQAKTLYGTLYNDTLTVTPGSAYEGIISYQGKDQITLEGDSQLSFSETRTSYGAASMEHTAIEADGDADIIDNLGVIDLNVASVVSVNPLSSTASARATGMDAAAGDDLIHNQHQIRVQAVAASSEADLEGCLLDNYMNDLMSAILGNGEDSVAISVSAEAMGIDAGGGENVIRNSGHMEIVSEANASAGAVVNKAAASARGIVTGGGDDFIENANQMAVASKAVVAPSNLSTTGGFVAVAAGKSKAEAQATGIESGSGDDTIENGKIMTVTSEAQATRDAISAKSPFFSLASGQVDADARSTGVLGEEGDDLISNKGALTVNATSEATIDSVTSDSGFVAITLAKPSATASAIGIHGGDGDDTIASGVIDMTASSHTHFKGDAAVLTGVALSSSTSSAASESVNIFSSEGDDTVTVDGKITAITSAGADAVKSSVSGAGASASPVWNGGTRAEAVATGVNSGYGDDHITVSSPMDLKATGNTTSDSGASTIAGVAVASAISKAKGDAVCVQGGEGDDSVVNRSTLKGEAQAQAAAVESTISGAGIASGTLFDGGTVAETSSAGISTGIGKDTITNTGALEITGASTVNTKSRSASIVGVSVSDTSTQAVSDVCGIKGGMEEDAIDNQSRIQATATADADSMSLSASLAGGALAVDGAIKGGTEAQADSVAIQGDSGSDHITNSGQVTAKATALSDAVRFTYSDTGLSLTADSSWSGGTRADASAIGIDGGWDQDAIENTALIEAIADAQSVSEAGSMTVIGIASSVSTSLAESRAVGIDGNAGSDTIKNSDRIKARSTSTVDQKQISASLAGASMTTDSLWEGGARASSGAWGIDGGSGEDTIENQGSLDAYAEATAYSSKTALTGVGLTLPEFSLWEASTVGEARAVGIDGNEMADDIDNFSSLTATAKTTVDGRGETVTLLGIGDSRTSVKGIADAKGIDGGSCGDRIDNNGSLTVNTEMTAYAQSVNVNVAGATAGDVRTLGETSARGVDGGSGADEISNTGEVHVNSQTTLDARGTTVTLLGGAAIDAKTIGTIQAFGIDGGSGNDTIDNDKTISVDSTGLSHTGALSVNLAGSAASRAGTELQIQSTGIAGGEGKDTITNNGLLESVKSSASMNLSNDAISLAGSVSGKNVLSAEATSVGMDGGSDADTLANLQKISVDTRSAVNSMGNATVIIGSSLDEGSVNPISNSVGMEGGDGNDQIENRAHIVAGAVSQVNLKTDAFSFIGTTESTGRISAITLATGISGGEGDDQIENSGEIWSQTTGDFTVGGNATTIIGSAQKSAFAGTDTHTAGMDGGGGNDSIFNRSKLRVESKAAVQLNANSFSFAGTAASQGELTALASTAGIKGGEGDDRIENTGDIALWSYADLQSSGGGSVIFGSANTGARVGSKSLSTGIDGGDGDDAIDNFNTITVESLSTMTLASSSFSLGGTSESKGDMATSPEACGVSGGSGNDIIRNQGTIVIEAKPTMTSESGATVIFGHAATDGAVRTETLTIGVDGGEGDDQIENSGTLDVGSLSTATLANSSFTFAGGAGSSGAVDAATSSTGVTGGDGADQVTNTGEILVDATSAMSANGTIATYFGNNQVCTTIQGSADGTGIRLGAGDNLLVNEKQITVTANAQSSSSTSSSFGWFSEGWSRAYSKGKADAVGVVAEDGNHQITNSGNLNVSSTTNSNSNAVSSKADLTLLDGDARAETQTYANATATGILLGSGNHAINNGGTLLVSASPTATATAFADGSGLGGDGDARASSSSGGEAWGIRIGDGGSSIENSGRISVNSYVIAASSATTDVEAGKSHTESYANITRAASYGILTGDGDQIITNSGTLEVDATPIYSGANGATLSNFQAVGVQTGTGNDLITNSGVILAKESNWIAFQSPGKAILTGEGDDACILAAGSKVFGQVNLGAGDDALSFEKNAGLFGLTEAENGVAQGGDGLDTLRFNGEGTNRAALEGFERVVKNDPGTYTVNALSSMERMEINDGTLLVENGYSMKPDGELFVALRSGTEYGRLQSNGEIRLDGSLTTERTSGAFLPGDVMDVVRGGSVTGEFDRVNLPESTPLLDFHYDQEADRAQIEVSVKSFTTVADTKNEKSMALYLDKVLPASTGELNQVIGEVQRASEKEVKRAFNTLGPSAYLRGATVARKNTLKLSDTVQNRMENRRTLVCLNQTEKEPLLLAYNGEDIGRFVGADPQEKSRNAWGNLFGQWGEQETTSRMAGFDYTTAGGAMGCDVAIFEKGLLGAGFGYSATGIDMDGSDSRSDMKEFSLSGYGSWLFDKAYVESMVSFGKGEMEMDKKTRIGSTRSVSTSSHDMDRVSVAAGGGYYFQKNDWLITPSATLHYMTLSQEGFREKGGGASLWVSSQSTDFLSLEAGVTLSRVFDQKGAFWVPEVSIAWNHEFDLDEGVVTAGFGDTRGAGGSFTINETTPETDSALIGAGLRFLAQNGVTSSVSFTTELKKNYTAYGLLADVRVAF